MGGRGIALTKGGGRKGNSKGIFVPRSASWYQKDNGAINLVTFGEKTTEKDETMYTLASTSVGNPVGTIKEFEAIFPGKKINILGEKMKW